VTELSEQLELKLTANTAKGFHSNETDKTANNALQEKSLLIPQTTSRKRSRST